MNNTWILTKALIKLSYIASFDKSLTLSSFIPSYDSFLDSLLILTWQGVSHLSHSLIDQPSILTPYLTTATLFHTLTWQALLSSISATSPALFHHLTRQATPYSTPLLDKPRPLSPSYSPSPTLSLDKHRPLPHPQQAPPLRLTKFKIGKFLFTSGVFHVDAFKVVIHILFRVDQQVIWT